MNQPKSIGRLIGARLYISGYIYTKNHSDKRRRTHWECTRCRKKVESEKCRARAMTLESPEGKPIVLRGPKESKHNHESTRAEVEEAEALAKKRQEPQWKQAAKSTSEFVKATLHRPDPQEKPVSETNEKINRIDFVKDPLMYRAFLEELVKKPGFDRENIMKALKVIYISKKSQLTAYEAIIENMARIKRDLEILTFDPNVKIKSLDGSHYSYDPVDPFESMTKEEVRFKMEQINFERQLKIRGVTLEQKKTQMINRLKEVVKKEKAVIEAFAQLNSDSDDDVLLSGTSTSRICSKCDKYILFPRYNRRGSSNGNQNQEETRNETRKSYHSDDDEFELGYQSKRFCGPSRVSTFDYSKPSTSKAPLFRENSNFSNYGRRIYEAVKVTEKKMYSDPKNNFRSPKRDRACLPRVENRETNEIASEPPSKTPKLVSDIKIPPIQISRIRNHESSRVGKSSTANILLLKYKRNPCQQPLQPTDEKSE
ncbi:hypothetical protein QAD02_006693 [Eretmocerus hayati]|uniref:Uncharacterized protein n=1 Tax=Eretmocerus hayati TaxID=131215 RepID=A0ACC2N1Y2_9HYME|nr:hypothetical protein QAD02_006693 [Eretmocerus hayati]